MFKFPKSMIMTMHDKMVMTTLLFVTSVTKNSVKIECVIIVICPVSFDYVDCLKKLDETSLPPKEEFYSNLTGEGITDEDYQHAHTV